MSNQARHQAANEAGSRRIGISRFLFQAGVGAVAISLLWCFLTSVDWRPDRTDLFPLVLFGVSLPWLVFPIPAHIISSATASGRFLMSISILMALLAVAVSVGRFVFSWDRVLVVVLGGSIVALGVLAQAVWARIWKGIPRTVFLRESILTIGGWITGLIAAPLFSLFGQPYYGLWVGAGALVASGWLVQFVPRKSTAPNWLSNRSALRLFAAIENALRSRQARLILLRVFWFCGSTLSLIAMIPPTAGIRGMGEIATGASFFGLAAVSLSLIAGLAGGSFPGMIRLSKSRPGLTLAIICLAMPAAALGVVLIPAALKWVPAFFLGVGFGSIMNAASHDLRRSLGTVFSSESEVLLWTVSGAGGVLFAACFWLTHFVLGFGPLLFIGAVLLFLGFAVTWRRAWIGAEKESDESGFDPWYAGKFENVANTGDGACLVSIAYEIPDESREAFSEAIRDLAHLRQRQGALYWTLVESADNPEILKEQFIIESSEAYGDAIRAETREDRQIKQRVFDLNRWDSLPSENRHPLLEA